VISCLKSIDLQVLLFALRFTTSKGFETMVKELHDLAGQHESIAEALQNNVCKDLLDTIQTIKQERKKVTISDSSLFVLFMSSVDLHVCMHVSHCVSASFVTGLKPFSDQYSFR